MLSRAEKREVHLHSVTSVSIQHLALMFSTIVVFFCFSFLGYLSFICSVCPPLHYYSQLRVPLVALLLSCSLFPPSSTAICNVPASASGVNKARVITLIHKGLNCKVALHQSNSEDRWSHIVLNIGKQAVSIHNVYGPNMDGRDFLRGMDL